MFNKKCKGRLRLKTLRPTATLLIYGVLGLKSSGLGFLHKHHTAYIQLRFKQILKKSSKIWIKSNVIYPVTRLSKEVRMGKGKGKINHYIYRILQGLIFIEISYSYFLDESLLFLNYIRMRLPLRSKVQKTNIYYI